MGWAQDGTSGVWEYGTATGNSGLKLSANNTTLKNHINATSAHGATNANTASTIVKRDASGNFSAGTCTFVSVAVNGAGNTTSTMRSGNAGNYCYWSLGRTTDEFILGVSAGAGQFFTGSGAFEAQAGDGIFKGQVSGTNRVLLGAGSGAATIVVGDPTAGTKFNGPIAATGTVRSDAGFYSGANAGATGVIDLTTATSITVENGIILGWG